MTQVFNTAQEARQWMPIETAPRDGTAMLVYTAGENINCMAYYEHGFDSFGDGEDPTHWMPLPEPPTPDIDPSPADEWEEVPCGDQGQHIPTGNRLFVEPADALKVILTHASEVRIDWPEWEAIGRSSKETLFCNGTNWQEFRDHRQLVLYALQIGAKVSMKRKAGV